ncbi:Tetratricopeptide-like helical domain superfamily [Sesbania bispinosa]|nr:Tetratricopeptide-like helical domain superfamily [Sesbania bispinosa]
MKLIVLLGKSGQPHRAHQLFDTIKEEGCESTELYTALIAAYCQNNLVDEAILTLDEMKDLPQCQPDFSIYSTLIKACVDALKFELVELLYEEMAERSITPNTSTQNIVLSGYGKAGRCDQMEKMLLSMMESTTCKPDVETMNIVISVFANKGQIDMMEKCICASYDVHGQPQLITLVNLAGKLQIRENTSFYNAVISACAKTEALMEIEIIFKRMKEKQCQPDDTTYSVVIEAYRKEGMNDKIHCLK